MEGRAAEARAKYQSDWPEARARILLAQDIEDELALGAAGEPLALSCQLPWAFSTSDGAGPGAHALACPDRPVRLTESELGTLKALSENRDASTSLPPRPAWLERLSGERWACLEEGPFRDLGEDPWARGVVTWPAIDNQQLRGLVRLSLADAERTKAVGTAALKNFALARLLLACEVMSAQFAGIDVLQTQHDWLVARKTPVQGLPSSAAIETLRQGRYSASQVLHPWVPDGEADQLRARMLPAARCAAVIESTIWATYSPLMQPVWPEYFGRMSDPVLLETWCATSRAHLPWAATRRTPDDAWERMYRGLGLSGNALWLMRLARLSSTVRRLVSNTLLVIATPKPVRSARNQ